MSTPGRSSSYSVKTCRCCGRLSTTKNPLTKHKLSEEKFLPFRSGRNLECKPCFNSVNLQCGGDAVRRASMIKDCEPESGKAAQLEKTMQWENMYNESPHGRITAGAADLRETASVENSCFLEAEKILGIVYPPALAATKLGRKPTRREQRTFDIGSQKIKGVLFPEVAGETIPVGCFRLRQGATTETKHTKLYDASEQQL